MARFAASASKFFSCLSCIFLSCILCGHLSTSLLSHNSIKSAICGILSTSLILYFISTVMSCNTSTCIDIIENLRICSDLKANGVVHHFCQYSLSSWIRLQGWIAIWFYGTTSSLICDTHEWTPFAVVSSFARITASHVFRIPFLDSSVSWI